MDDKTKEVVAATFVEPVKTDAQKADATTLTFNVYVMYKLNMLSRIQVRDYLNLIKDGKHPDDVLDYLQKEVAKLS